MAMLDYRRILFQHEAQSWLFTISHMHNWDAETAAPTPKPEPYVGRCLFWKSGLNCADDVLDFPAPSQIDLGNWSVNLGQWGLTNLKCDNATPISFQVDPVNSVSKAHGTLAEGPRDPWDSWGSEPPTTTTATWRAQALSGPQESLSLFIAPMTLHSMGWLIKVSG